MGCNIHDDMVGYIYITDARWYGKTNADGKFTLTDLTAGDVEVTIWSPRIADARETLKRTAKLADTPGTVEFRLQKDLRGTPEPRPRDPNWEY